MRTGTCSYSYGIDLTPLNPPPELREAFADRRRTAAPGHGFAGTDLDRLWDARLFLSQAGYGREFMKRMHHPFHEVLACLYLNAGNAAIAYNSYFRGERATALAHLPTVLQSATRLGAVRILLSHNPAWVADYRPPNMGLLAHQIQASGIELHDFLLLRGDTTLSLRTQPGS